MISILLMLIYPLAIQYERKGLCIILLPLYIIAGFLSFLANHTEMSLIYGWPRKGEWTLSKRLRRLSYLSGWRGTLAFWMANYTDKFDPDGYHADPYTR